MASIVAKLRERQPERDALLAEIGAAGGIANITVDRARIERSVLAQVANWRAMVVDGISWRAVSSCAKCSTGRSSSSLTATRIGSVEPTGEVN